MASLRLDLQEMSWAGMGSVEVDEIAEVFAAALRDGQDPAAVGKRTCALIEAHRPAGPAEQVLRVALAAAGGDVR